MKKKIPGLLTKLVTMMIVCSIMVSCVAISASADTSVISDKEFTLTVWVQSDDADLEKNPYLRNTIEGYKKLYPNATVQVEGKGRPEQLYDALNIAISANAAPDIFWANIGQVVSFYVENDKLQSLDDYAQQYGWYDAYPQSTIDYQKTFFGDFFGLPQDLYSMGLWYKKDVFEKYGLSEPKTYQELLDACATLKENDIVPLAMAGKWPAIITRLVDALLEKEAGAELHDSLFTGKASFNCQEVINTFARYKNDWVDNGYFQEGFLSAEETEVYMLWYPSKACFWISGDWEIANAINAEQDTDNLGFCAFPTDQENARAHAYGNGYFIPVDSQQKDEAAAFLNVLSSEEVQKSYQAQYGDTNSCRIGVIDTATVSAAKAQLLEVKENYGSFVPTNEIGLNPKMTDAWLEAIDKVTLGLMTPEDAAQSLDEQAIECGWYK